LTEYPSYWGEHPDLFAACAAGKDDVEQMVNVLRWFIGTLKGQYMSRNTSMGSEKKVRSTFAKAKNDEDDLLTLFSSVATEPHFGRNLFG
jgi:hypothetical protein